MSIPLTAEEISSIFDVKNAKELEALEKQNKLLRELLAQSEAQLAEYQRLKVYQDRVFQDRYERI